MEPIYQLTEEEKQETKKKFPDVILEIIQITTDDGRKFEGIFKKPSFEAIQKYFADNVGSAEDGGIQKSYGLIFETIVCPTKEVYFDIHKAYPLLSVGVGNKIVEGKGMVKEAKKKVL